jgi:hypothetical protein
MSKLSWKDKDEIIKRDLPGYRIVHSKASESADVSAEETQPEADAGTPDIRELRRKYFGIADELSNGPAVSADSVSDSDEDELVRVELENKPDELDRGSRAKSVLISGGEVKGSQG